VNSRDTGANELLRQAMGAARVPAERVAQAVGVDPKTVQRWLAGRVPRARHRWAVADLLGVSEGALWPQSVLQPAGGDASAEVVAVYAHRVDAPLGLWHELLEAARERIDVLGYAVQFLPEQHPRLVETTTAKCQAGCKVRIVVADPDCLQVRLRDQEERLGGAMAFRIRTTLRYLAPIRRLPGVELRYQDAPMYNSVFRFDDDMLVTPHLYGTPGFRAPLLQLRRAASGGVFDTFASHFEAVWDAAHPAPDEPGEPGTA
jgi:transcriptional regulator with XRE-family HTH domain